jgi:hypothetical protein
LADPFNGSVHGGGESLYSALLVTARERGGCSEALVMPAASSGVKSGREGRNEGLKVFRAFALRTILG